MDFPELVCFVKKLLHQIRGSYPFQWDGKDNEYLIETFTIIPKFSVEEHSFFIASLRILGVTVRDFGKIGRLPKQVQIDVVQRRDCDDTHVSILYCNKL
jgi:hypothetical protein